MISQTKETSIEMELKATISSLYEKFISLIGTDVLKTPKRMITQASSFDKRCLDSDSYRNEMNKSENIVLVDDKFKLLYNFDFDQMMPKKGVHKSNRTYEFSVDKYHGNLSTLKFADVTEWENFPRGCFLITLKLKNNAKYNFFVKKDENREIEHSLKHIADLVPEMCVEVSERKKIRWNTYSFPLCHWDNTWDEDKLIYNHFANRVDPIMLEMFENHILPMSKKQDPLLILDVGAGKGRLAEKLIRLAQSHKIPLHYILLEPNKSQCKIASEMIAVLKNTYEDNFLCEVSVINSTLKVFSTTEAFTKYVGKINGVISSGGPLNVRVADFRDARDNLARIETLLCEHSKIIASGLTQSMFTKSLFQKLGFDVLNTCKKIKINDTTEFIQCYVYEKKTPEPDHEFKINQICQIDNYLRI